MTHYIAKFSNGKTKEIKQGTRDYAAAYCTIVRDIETGTERSFIGFSRTKELAERASISEANYAVRGFKKPYQIIGEIIFREIVEAVKV